MARAAHVVDLASLPVTLTVEEAAGILGVSRGTAYEAVRSGELPSVRLGRRLLIPRARLLQLLGEPVALPDVPPNEPA
jgi:excisionase family DNA binding protein